MMRLIVDLSNKSAQLVDDETGRVEAQWSGVTRGPALVQAQTAGWVPIDIDRAGAPRWSLTNPPDGFWCRVTQIRKGERGACSTDNQDAGHRQGGVDPRAGGRGHAEGGRGAGSAGR